MKLVRPHGVRHVLCFVAGLTAGAANLASAADAQPTAVAASAPIKIKSKVAAGAVAASGSIKNGPAAVNSKTSISTGGENAYPAGGLLVPPKPKKDGPETAVGVKAKMAQP